MDVLTTRNLTKTYRGRNVVDNVNMHVEKGDVYGFIGRNGAGKTTLMKMVCGLTRTSSVSLNCLDQIIWEREEKRLAV